MPSAGSPHNDLLSDRQVLLRRQLQATLRSATENAHGRCARLLGLRNRINAELALSEIETILNRALQFVVTSEQQCGTALYALRGVLALQAKEFAIAEHAKSVQRIRVALDSEVWDNVLAPRSTQRMIDRKFIGAFQDMSRRVTEQLPLGGAKSWRLPHWTNDSTSSSSGDEVDNDSKPDDASSNGNYRQQSTPLA